MFLSFLVGGMLTMTPVLQYAMMINKSIIPMSILLTLGTFGGCSLYAMNQPIGRFNAWGGPLFGALLSVLVLNLSGALSLYMMGPNMFSNLIFSAYPYVGIGLFSLFQIYDTDVAMTSYKEGVLDPLNHSISFILNLKNLFINFVQILSRFTGGD